MRTVNHWHASAIKNWSHVRAAENFAAEASQLVVMCLDCDNVFATQFLRQVMQQLQTAHDQVTPSPAVKASSGELATTGRVAYMWSDFLVAGGYDQESDTAPSGYQDIDICVRLRKNAEVFGGLAPQPKKHSAILVSVGVGCAFPNAADRKEDRGWAKICNVEEHIRGLYKNWSAMNSHNVSVMQKKLKERNHGIRNVTHEPDVWLRMSMAEKTRQLLTVFNSGLAGKFDKQTYVLGALPFLYHPATIASKS